MTSNNPTGKTPSTYRVRDVDGDEIAVQASQLGRSVYLETPHELFVLDMQAAHKLACVLLLACEEVLSGPAEAGEKQ